MLPPSRLTARRAAAVAAPALDPVRAAPGRALEDLRLVHRGKHLERLGQVDQLHVAALGELADGRRHHLVAALAMVPEGLAVHRYRQHFIVLAPLREAGLEAAEQIVAAAQGLAEGDRARDRAVVEEDGKGGAGGQANEVRSRRIEARADHVQPLAARGADPPAL